MISQNLRGYCSSKTAVHSHTVVLACCDTCGASPAVMQSQGGMHAYPVVCYAKGCAWSLWPVRFLSYPEDFVSSQRDIIVQVVLQYQWCCTREGAIVSEAALLSGQRM